MSPLLVVVLLALLLGIQPVTTDVYLPALPALQADLRAPMAEVQLTFAALLLAFGTSQLVWGPLSDRFGRKWLVLSGLAIFVAGSAICALATTLPQLIGGRVVQALGAPSRDTGPCDIIVADYDLNGPLSGTDAIGEIRTRQGWLVPAIIVTAHDEDRIRSEMHGAVLPILPKPTRPAELRSVMLGMLAGGERPAPRA